jgi:hypothetical protein
MIKLIDTESPLYKQTFGCGTAAIFNVLHKINHSSKNDSSIMNLIAKSIKEKNYESKSSNIKNCLNKLEIDFEFIDNVSYDDIKNHLGKNQPLILLSFKKDELASGVGHYYIVYGDKSLAFATNKIFCDVDIKKALSLKNNIHTPKAWLILNS